MPIQVLNQPQVAFKPVSVKDTGISLVEANDLAAPKRWEWLASQKTIV